jgi:hypothetical protein
METFGNGNDFTDQPEEVRIVIFSCLVRSKALCVGIGIHGQSSHPLKGWNHQALDSRWQGIQGCFIHFKARNHYV